MQRLRIISAKIALWAGVTLTLIAIAGASVMTYPAYVPEYYSVAAGLSLIAAGLLSLID